MSSQGYRDLLVWQKAMDLVTEVYKIVKMLPKEETYALSDQMRRAAVSVPSNISEGQARRSNKEFANFLSISRGSLAELETQILICIRLNYIKTSDAETAQNHVKEVARMLNVLITKLTTDN